MHQLVLLTAAEVKSCSGVLVGDGNRELGGGALLGDSGQLEGGSDSAKVMRQW